MSKALLKADRYNRGSMAGPYPPGAAAKGQAEYNIY